MHLTEFEVTKTIIVDRKAVYKFFHIYIYEQYPLSV